MPLAPRDARRQRGVLAGGLVLLSLLNPAWAGDGPRDDQGKKRLLQLSLDQLAELEVTTVSRKPESLREAPAAVHVVTGDDVRRTGTTSLADSLRLAPGVHVVRIDSNKWGFGVRGFTSRLSRSMLALIDGRSVYTPLFAGVYWEVQDTLLEDVDRVEVIRGPGGALWGANAVNGVVNVITKNARQSQGLFATGGWGPQDTRVAVRYGGRLAESAFFRVYGKYFDSQPEFHADAQDFDGWHMAQGGFRLDWERDPGDTITLQGDLYGGRAGQRTTITEYEPPFFKTLTGEADLSGNNVLALWRRRFPGGSALRVQGYYDRTKREEISFGEVRGTFDLDVQHSLRASGRQEIVYGAGYRRSGGDTTGVTTIAFVPARRADDLFTGFVQDEIRLHAERLSLVLGAKLEHNDYSGLEVQPSARLAWSPHTRHSFWAAVSRAVRTPSRVEHDLVGTTSLSATSATFARIQGNPAFQSERVIAYEAGYRSQPVPRLLLDFAGFHNRYDDLLSLESAEPFSESDPPPARLIVPFTVVNGLRGRSTGFEMSATATLASWWRARAAYSFLDLDLRSKPDHTGAAQTASQSTSPRHQLLFRSSMELGRRVEVDGVFRWVGALRSQQVGAYSGLDLRLAWRLDPSWTVSATGRDLLQGHHPEFGGAGSAEIKRSVFLDLAWRR